MAIKLLPEAFSHDADRVARFGREARVLASLNHPNIAAIYGVEASDGRSFLVMELVLGETLAERIRRGAIPVAGDIMGLVSIVSLAASISAMTFAGPRVYYAMARDGLFFPSAACIHPRFQTPAFSIVAQTVWSGLLVLSGGASALTRYTGFAVVLFAGVAVSALFVLRVIEPNAPRPFKAFGYPIAPALFALASFLMVVDAIYSDPGPSGAGVLVIAAGVPLYLTLGRGREALQNLARL